LWKIGVRRKERKKGTKKERKESLVETDASDGNPLTTRIPTAAWKAQSAFHRSHKADDGGPITRFKKGDIFNEVRKGTF
jgi:hypothetical protein